MKNFVGILGLCVVLAGAFAVASYVTNAVRIITECDFSADTSFKCEIIRPVGVFIPPIGIIVGFIDLE